MNLFLISQHRGTIMRFAISLLLVSSLSSQASELVYRPTNPNFGGNALNAAGLLSNAQSQNKHKEESSASSASQRTALDRFTSTLEARLLNQLMTDIGNGNTGSLVTEDFIVNIVDEDGVLTVNITDLASSETTEIEVSGLDPDN